MRSLRSFARAFTTSVENKAYRAYTLIFAMDFKSTFSSYQWTVLFHLVAMYSLKCFKLYLKPKVSNMQHLLMSISILCHHPKHKIQLSNRRYLSTGKITMLWLQPLLSLCQFSFTIILMKFPDTSGFWVILSCKV